MVQILVKQQQLNCCVFSKYLKQLKERNLMLVKDLITLLKDYSDDTRVALPIRNSSNYSETITHEYGDILILEGSRQ